MITEVAFSHDGARYFTADWNGKIEAWNTLDFKKIGELSTTPPSVENRIISISQDMNAIEADIVLHREKNTTADIALKGALAAADKASAELSVLKKESSNFQQEFDSLAKKWEQLEQMVSKKVKDRDQITQKIKETIQQKIKTEQEHLKSTAEKQKLERERIAADRTLIAAAQDTANKREASSRDPENIETKNLLIVAEQIEDLARQVTQRYTGKLATLNKLIATQATSIESLITEIPELNARTEQLTTEHQQLITQRAKAAEEKDINLAKMKATQSKILRIEKQVQLLKKTAQDQEKILIAAQKELTNTMDKRSKFAERLKKWKTAAVNTRLIETRLELASIDKDDPAVASKIVELQRKCDDLALKYQAAKK